MKPPHSIVLGLGMALNLKQSNTNRCCFIFCNVLCLFSLVPIIKPQAVISCFFTHTHIHTFCCLVYFTSLFFSDPRRTSTFVLFNSGVEWSRSPRCHFVRVSWARHSIGIWLRIHPRINGHKYTFSYIFVLEHNQSPGCNQIDFSPGAFSFRAKRARNLRRHPTNYAMLICSLRIFSAAYIFSSLTY